MKYYILTLLLISLFTHLFWSQSNFFGGSKNNLTQTSTLNLKQPSRQIAMAIDDFNSPHQIVRKAEKVQFIYENKNFNFEVSILNENEIQNIFNFLASQKHIPFNYLQGGCHARAHEMSILLDKKNILTGKAFLQGDLRLETKKSPDNVIKWSEHVAPFIFVEKEGQLKIYILDPSIFNSAVESKMWIHTQTQHLQNSDFKTFYTPRFYYDRNSFMMGLSHQYETYDIESMNVKMDEYLKLQNLKSDEPKDK